MENKTEEIYIVLVKANTILGRITRKLFHYEYTHIAISLDKELKNFITFSRRKHYTPFDCGYMVEDINCYAYGRNKKVKCKIFKLQITKEKKKEIKQFINKVSKDKEYIFNFYSMLTMPMIHGFQIYKSHNCMSFVSKIIELTNEIEFTKKYYQYNIQEIDHLLSNYQIDEKYFYKEKEDNKEYMKIRGLLWNTILFLLLNGKLCYRICMKRKQIKEEW